MATLTSAEVKAQLEAVQLQIYNARMHTASSVGPMDVDQVAEMTTLLDLQSSLQQQYNAIKSFTIETDM